MPPVIWAGLTLAAALSGRDSSNMIVLGVGLTLLLARGAVQTLRLLLAGVVIPFLFWCAMIGFVVYVHHTHVKVSWHDDKAAWARAQPFVSTTVHLTFPLRIGALVHHIMEHTAHHVDMSIPLYRLKNAQQMLEVLSQNPQLRNTVAGYAPRPDYRPLTKFEQRGLNLGHGVWDLMFKVVRD